MPADTFAFPEQEKQLFRDVISLFLEDARERRELEPALKLRKVLRSRRLFKKVLDEAQEMYLASAFEGTFWEWLFKEGGWEKVLEMIQQLIELFTK